MRLVLDTNILVSGSISRHGPPGRLLDAVRQHRAVLVTSRPQLDELHDVLMRPKFDRLISREVRRELVGMIDSVAEIADDLPVIETSPDPDDNLILATAVAGRAELIVSGDKNDMLALGEVRGIPIVTAAEAVTRIEAEGDDD